MRSQLRMVRVLLQKQGKRDHVLHLLDVRTPVPVVARSLATAAAEVAVVWHGVRAHARRCDAEPRGAGISVEVARPCTGVARVAHRPDWFLTASGWFCAAISNLLRSVRANIR